MKILTRQNRGLVWGVAGVLFLMLLCGVLSVRSIPTKAASQQDNTGGRLLTVYDRGEKNSFLTNAPTIEAALDEVGIELDNRDTVEPSRTEELIAPEYKVNIYRARPVVVIDGEVRQKIMTPYQTAERIAHDADITLYPEDSVTLSRSDDFITDGAGLQLTIHRSVAFTFDLYGRKTTVRTQARTVGGMLKEKNIVLRERDRVSPSVDTFMTAGMEVRVWREGRQTLSIDQPIGFATEYIYDADRPLGYRAVQTPGTEGVRTITYEIEIKEGEEVSRVEIAQIVAKQPKKQTVAIGIQGIENGISRNRGALFHTDSNGVVHRETYYDLDMGVVMQSCGQGGRYSVRFDGVKIDSEGYVIIAANYARYPKCSIVETSVGPGRVYDTGGFVARHPDGFDIATDWTNNNGR